MTNNFCLKINDGVTFYVISNTIKDKKETKKHTITKNPSQALIEKIICNILK